jgi:hypothetical protein
MPSSVKPPRRHQGDHADVPFTQHCASTGCRDPRRHHRAKGKRSPAAVGATRALPGNALRQRRGGGEGWEGVGGRAPPRGPDHSWERSGSLGFPKTPESELAPVYSDDVTINSSLYVRIL